jgi:SAM-dependent methyltransferase
MNSKGARALYEPICSGLEYSWEKREQRVEREKKRSPRFSREEWREHPDGKAPMFQYNHNVHYADLLLSEVPAACRSALDVGCGDGGFARRLADQFSAFVTGIDQDRVMIERARTLVEDRQIRFVEADFLRYAFDEQFDFIAASASLHHMPFEQALLKMAALLLPGGVLAVLGLFREASLTDPCGCRGRDSSQCLLRTPPWASCQWSANQAAGDVFVRDS